MEKYVDGFVLPVPKENLEKYREMARKAGEIWKEHGALEFYECVGDDLEIPDMLSFRTVAGAKEDETVMFSWIMYESREQRDKVNELVMNDPRLKEDMDCNKDIVDFKRMAYGGFKPLVTILK